MARTMAKQVLDRVDALLPNGYARAEKLRWLAQAAPIPTEKRSVGVSCTTRRATPP